MEQAVIRLLTIDGTWNHLYGPINPAAGTTSDDAEHFTPEASVPLNADTVREMRSRSERLPEGHVPWFRGIRHGRRLRPSQHKALYAARAIEMASSITAADEAAFPDGAAPTMM